MIEKKRRSIIKVFSWRVTATVTTVVITYLITGSTDFAVKVGGIEVVAKLILQYVHERIWLKIKFGIAKQIDYQI